MSQENVEIVRAADDAWNAGNSDALRELYDPDIVARPNDDWPERGPFFGREAVMRWFEQVRSTWDSTVVETVSRTDAGDRVVSRRIVHGAGHGPALRLEHTIVATVRKGKIVYIEFFRDHAEALEAVGLSE